MTDGVLQTVAATGAGLYALASLACSQVLGLACELISETMMYRFPLGIFGLVLVTAGGLIAIELRGARRNEPREPAGERRRS